MNDTQYNLMADELILALEEAIEDCGIDIDYEGVGGMLTLTFKNASKIIVNKQAPLHEIWVATKFNGHHFHFEDGQWQDKRGGGEFWQFISNAVSIQADSQVSLQAD
ncbi:iron donor protein CyaY [Thalassotalea marina]|uniref:Iron-sulfur cluster assembly protein CyaY n=1 Tax=Thalassotalea marina TaxID=1673741 RepID=A0A919EJK2_9GAMM|nr:iron donor protein CyaY [Thalassotalea marina]GHF88804.1 protein CyaY [Thalassotalea marina]